MLGILENASLILINCVLSFVDFIEHNQINACLQITCHIVNTCNTIVIDLV